MWVGWGGADLPSWVLGCMGGESRLSDCCGSLLQTSSCHRKIDELFSGKLYLIGIAAIVVAVIMVSVTAWCPAVVGWGKATSGCPSPVPFGLDPSLSSGCVCGSAQSTSPLDPRCSRMWQDQELHHPPGGLGCQGRHPASMVNREHLQPCPEGQNTMKPPHCLQNHSFLRPPCLVAGVCSGKGFACFAMVGLLPSERWVAWAGNPRERRDLEAFAVWLADGRVARYHHCCQREGEHQLLS